MSESAGTERRLRMRWNPTWRRILCLILLPSVALSLAAETRTYPQPILQTGQTGIAYALQFSPDSSIVATANGHRVTLWDRDHRWLVRELLGHTADVEAIAFAPRGSILASVTRNGELAIWNWDTGALLKMRHVNSDRLVGVAYASGGRILTVGDDRAVRLWDDRDCAESCMLFQTPESPQSLAVSPDERWIAVGDTVNSVTVLRADLSTRLAWLYNSLKLPDSRSDGVDFIRGLTFDKRSRLAAANFGGAVVLQDVSSWTPVLVQHTGLRLDSVVVDPDGARLYVAGMEDPNAGRAIAFNIADGSRAGLPELPQYSTANTFGPYRSAAITRDGKWLMAGGPLLIQWDLTKGTPPAVRRERSRDARLELQPER